MRRADRLFLIIHALQGRRTALPARRLADSLGVSLRTVYRDVADLQTSGVAIEGEAGVGYLLRKGSDIPPLMFTAEELESLVVGTRFVRAFTGERLAHGAQSAMLKIDAVLPAELRGRAERSRVFVPQRWYEAKSGMVDALHEAIESRRVLKLEYRDADGSTSTREMSRFAWRAGDRCGRSAHGAVCAWASAIFGRTACSSSRPARFSWKRANAVWMRISPTRACRASGSSDDVLDLRWVYK